MNTTLSKDLTCPYCGVTNNRHTSASSDKAGATEGDVSVCVSCGEISIYTAEMLLRESTPEELSELKNSGSWPQIEIIQRYSRLSKKKKQIDVQ